MSPPRIRTTSRRERRVGPSSVFELILEREGLGGEEMISFGSEGEAVGAVVLDRRPGADMVGRLEKFGIGEEFCGRGTFSIGIYWLQIIEYLHYKLSLLTS